MHVDDIAKTTFQMHQGLFEFLVMLFGLMNTPVTFEVLINELLHPYLRRFILVFFDNILVYNNSWSKHLQHVRLILTALKEHLLAHESNKSQKLLLETAETKLSSIRNRTLWFCQDRRQSGASSGFDEGILLRLNDI
jgi:hypothetical protein